MGGSAPCGRPLFGHFRVARTIGAAQMPRWVPGTRRRRAGPRYQVSWTPARRSPRFEAAEERRGTVPVVSPRDARLVRRRLQEAAGPDVTKVDAWNRDATAKIDRFLG